MQIANITATYDGETVEDHDDVGRSSLSSLLHSGDEIVIHEVHDEEQIEDLKERYPEWEEKVSLALDDEEDDSDSDEDADGGNRLGSDECWFANCSEEPDMVAQPNHENVKPRFYCEEHAGGYSAGGAYVEEWVEL